MSLSNHYTFFVFHIYLRKCCNTLCSLLLLPRIFHVSFTNKAHEVSLVGTKHQQNEKGATPQAQCALLCIRTNRILTDGMVGHGQTCGLQIAT